MRQAQERWFEKKMVSSGLFEMGDLPTLVDFHLSKVGWVFRVAVSPMMTAEDLGKRAERLAVAFGARGVRIWRNPAHAGRVELIICYTDPLAQELDWPWAGMGPFDLWQALPLGYGEDGEATLVGLAEHHVLIGGEPGAGKSNAMSLVVAAAAGDPHVELWLFDGKLVELAQWKEVAERFVGADTVEATVALGELRTEMEARYQLLLDGKLRKVTKQMGLGLVVVVIDELALYLQGPKAERDAFGAVLRDVVARGRAAGIVVVAATQKPSTDVVPSSIRDLFGFRLALRCATKDASDTILGSGWASQGYSASEIDGSTRGVGWLLAEGTVPKRMRCYRLDDEGLASAVHAAETVRSQASTS
jgi:S-DNA-T family DNA segregation ATPase FtsK/SpoIIIE